MFAEVKSFTKSDAHQAPTVHGGERGHPGPWGQEVTTSAWFKMKHCWQAYHHVEKYSQEGET